MGSDQFGQYLLHVLSRLCVHCICMIINFVYESFYLPPIIQSSSLTHNLSSNSAVFNWGDMSPSRDVPDFDSWLNNICCHEKIKSLLRSNNVALQEIEFSLSLPVRTVPTAYIRSIELTRRYNENGYYDLILGKGMDCGSTLNRGRERKPVENRWPNIWIPTHAKVRYVDRQRPWGLAQDRYEWRNSTTDMVNVGKSRHNSFSTAFSHKVSLYADRSRTSTAVPSVAQNVNTPIPARTDLSCPLQFVLASFHGHRIWLWLKNWTKIKVD